MVTDCSCQQLQPLEPRKEGDENCTSHQDIATAGTVDCSSDTTGNSDAPEVTKGAEDLLNDNLMMQGQVQWLRQANALLIAKVERYEKALKELQFRYDYMRPTDEFENKTNFQMVNEALNPPTTEPKKD